jgi:hypothetical protein
MNTDHNDGLTLNSDQFLISDHDLDALAEAQLAWERNQRTQLWWATGNLDDSGACEVA